MGHKKKNKRMKSLKVATELALTNGLIEGSIGEQELQTALTKDFDQNDLTPIDQASSAAMMKSKHFLGNRSNSLDYNCK